MILLKGFLRKKSTKIYLAILITLLIAIITLFSLINYYKHQMNEIFEDSSDIFIVSNTDYYNNLIKSKDFNNVRKTLAFKPNYSLEIFGRQCMEEHDVKTGYTIDNYDSCNQNSTLNWEHFLFDEWKSDIVVLPDSKLADNQVIMGYQEAWNEWEKNSKHLIGKQVNFYLDEQLIEFTIKRFDPFRFPRVFVSTDVFKKLSNDSKLYAYLGTPKDFFQASLVEQNLKTLNNIEYVRINTMYTEKANDNINFFFDLVDYLTLASYLMIIILIIILITVTRNIIADETKNIHIERLLGYNSNQVRKYLLLKILVLTIAVILIGTIGSMIINILINFSTINLNIFNHNLLLKIYGGLLLIALFLSIFYGVRINKMEVL